MKKTGTKTKIFPAYTNDKPTFKKRKGAGVYFIYDKEKTLQYIGYSGSCLYKALYRHFQEWADKKQQRFTYPKSYFVRVIDTTPARAALLEKYLILKMKPPGGLIKYESYTDKEKEKCKTILENLEINNEELEAAPF